MPNQKVIPITRQDLIYPAIPPTLIAGLKPVFPVFDTLNRQLHDLRISVTDRCNFRCQYCMPKEVFNHHYQFLPQKDLLTFEEITRIASLFVRLGVSKIRLTGGEPLLRKNIEKLIDQLSQLKTPQGQSLDLTLTTNGSILAQKAQVLKEAGLNRVTVSLDALSDATFKSMNDVDFPVSDVLKGIEAAKSVGLGMDSNGRFTQLKINMVVKASTNRHEILPMAHYFKDQGLALRFIEYMDVGSTNGWNMSDVIPSDEILTILRNEFDLISLPPQSLGETAQRWAYANKDGSIDMNSGEIGFISSVSQPFCSTCNRARLSTEGKLYLCLFANSGFDLRNLLRGNYTDEQILDTLAHTWINRSDQYSALRSHSVLSPNAPADFKKIEMSYIGG